MTTFKTSILSENGHTSPILKELFIFHSALSEIDISDTLLQATFKQCGVKIKLIRRGKKVIEYGNLYFFKLFRDIYQGFKATPVRDAKVI